MNARYSFGLTSETTIRDSLYDIVPLSAEASRLLATTAMLRLDGIQQLGFVSRIWPGARHSRFEHSIGVMHLMREALIRLRSTGVDVSDAAARTGIAAALLHDVGHYPFSHAIEELGPPVPSHETVGRRYILSIDVSTVLERDWGVDPLDVARLIDPDDESDRSEHRICRQLLSGPLDVDKLDYLPRDARACAVPYGGVDTTRLLQSLTCIETPTGSVLGIDQKGISPLHSLFNARQEMFDNVYWHHTNRACMAMLLRAVQDALDAGLDPDELTEHTDASLLVRLGQPDMPVTTRRIVDGLRTRRFHKRAVEISSRATGIYNYLSAMFANPGHRRSLERALTARIRSLADVDVHDGDILIDIPKPEKWRSNVWVHYQDPPAGLAPVMSWFDATGIDERHLSIYEHHRRLVRIVAVPAIRDLVREHWESAIYPLLQRRYQPA